MTTDKELLAMCDEVILREQYNANTECYGSYTIATELKRRLTEPQSKSQYRRMTAQGWTSEREKALLAEGGGLKDSSQRLVKHK